MKVAGTANHDHWLSISEEIVDLHRPVSRVERHKHVTGPECSQVEEQGVRRFVDLNNNPGRRAKLSVWSRFAYLPVTRSTSSQVYARPPGVSRQGVPRSPGKRASIKAKKFSFKTLSTL